MKGQSDESAAGLAAGWFARRRAGDMSAAEIAELEAWLAADPGNASAFEAVERAWSSVALTRSAPEIMAIRAEARRQSKRAGPRVLARAVAVVLALVLVGGGSLWVGREAGETRSRSLASEVYQTAVGERSTMTLRDGTVVTLNTDTILRTRAAEGRRLVYLEKGQAFFRVAKDPKRPFMVAAAGRTITALGTAFDVRVDGKTFEVTLVEGKIKVENPPTVAAKTAPSAVPATEMVAGSQLVAAASGPAWSVAPVDTGKETSWLTGWLYFEDEPLGAVAAEFNRYSPRKVVVTDAALAATPVSGRFEAGDVEAFARALESYEIAKVEAATPSTIRLSAR